jgi:hypothetical protein
MIESYRGSVTERAEESIQVFQGVYSGLIMYGWGWTRETAQPQL